MLEEENGGAAPNAKDTKLNEEFDEDFDEEESEGEKRSKKGKVKKPSIKIIEDNN